MTHRYTHTATTVTAVTATTVTSVTNILLSTMACCLRERHISSGPSQIVRVKERYGRCGREQFILHTMQHIQLMYDVLAHIVKGRVQSQLPKPCWLLYAVVLPLPSKSSSSIRMVLTCSVLQQGSWVCRPTEQLLVTGPVYSLLKFFSVFWDCHERAWCHFEFSLKSVNSELRYM